MNYYSNQNIITVKIEEIECFYCFKVITELLREYEGVEKLNVGLDSKVVKVSYKENEFEVENFIQRLSDVGYKFQIISQ